jgi:hypothetical protein
MLTMLFSLQFFWNYCSIAVVICCICCCGLIVALVVHGRRPMNVGFDSIVHGSCQLLSCVVIIIVVVVDDNGNVFRGIWQRHITAGDSNRRQRLDLHLATRPRIM